MSNKSAFTEIRKEKKMHWENEVQNTRREESKEGGFYIMNLGKAFFIIVRALKDVEEWMGGNHLKGKRWRRLKMYERGNIFLQR